MAAGDLFRARLDQIINMKHELVQLAGKVDWAWIDNEMAPLYSDKGRPGIESRDDVRNLSQIWAVAPALAKLALRDDRRGHLNKEPPWKKITEGPPSAT